MPHEHIASQYKNMTYEKSSALVAYIGRVLCREHLHVLGIRASSCVITLASPFLRSLLFSA